MNLNLPVELNNLFYLHQSLHCPSVHLKNISSSTFHIFTMRLQHSHFFDMYLVRDF